MGHAPSGHVEPGTGTQRHYFATPPGDDKPDEMRIDGRVWKVGKQYLDTVLRDVCTLTAIVGKSGAMDTRDPRDCPKRLVFVHENYRGYTGDRVTICPHGRNETPLDERFLERCEPHR